MRKLFTYALIALFVSGFVSCQKFEAGLNDVSDEYSVIVKTEDTKTVNDGIHTSWVDGDAMTMFYKRSSGSLHSSKFTYSSSTGKFSGTASSVYSSYSYNWWGVYPYSSDNDDNTAVHAEIPSTQTQEGNNSTAHLAGSGFPLWGKTTSAVPDSSTPVFTAYQVATALNFVITNGGEKEITVNKIEFTAPSAIAGACEADLTASTVKWAPRSSGTSSTITLSVNGGTAIAKNASASFYAGAIPFSGNGSYTVNVYATSDGKSLVSTKTVTAELNCESGKINKIKHTFDGKEVTYKTYTKATTFESGKKYIIAYDGQALQNNNGTPAAYTVTASGNTVSLPADVAATLEWTATGVSDWTTSGHYTLTNNGKFAARTDDSKNGFEFLSAKAQKAVWDLDSDGNDVYHKNSNGQYTFYLNYTGSKWDVSKTSGSNKTVVYVEGGDSPEPPTPGTDRTYTKVTTEPGDWSGTYLIVRESSSSTNYIFAYDESNYKKSVDSYIGDGKIVSNDLEKYELTISQSSLGAGKYDVRTSNGKYLYKYSSDILFDTNISNNNQYFSEFSGNGNVTMNSHREGGSDNYFSYSNSKFGYGSSSSATIQLYKLENGGSGKQTQTISFANATETWTLGETYKVGNTYAAQSVTGAKTTVTFTSSNASVATISDGKIKIVGTGETTITATAAEDATYKSATASYKLTIKSASTGDKTYTKVTEAPDDWTEGKYLIVDEESNVAFAYDQSNFKTSVTISGNKIVSNDLEKYEMTISLSDDGDTGGDHFDIKTSNGKYLYRSSADGSSFLNDSYTYNSHQYYNKIDAGSTAGNFKLTSKYSEAKTTYKFYYSSSSSAFKYSSSSNSVQLYKLENGGGGGDEPTPPGTTFDLENSYLKQYLDAAATSYTNSTTKSIVSTYSGSSSSRDLPSPVKLSWTGSATSISIYEGSSTSGTPVKTQSFSSSTSASIYNLIPGKTYSYKTSNGATGTFNTAGRRRMIKVSNTASQNHARNCRDFGGIKTRKGETLKYGMMYRGTNMDGVTDNEEEKKILVNELGIKLDQDLRGSSKSPIGVTISGQAYDSRTIQNQDGNNMKTTVSDVLNSVIKGDPVYIHCLIGSDRTGHMCMLYLALLGCELKECDIDYEITSFASSMTGGTRTIGSGNESSFREKFIKGSYTNDKVPEAVENYVVNTLGISIDTVKKYRKAMGVSETL